MGPHGTLGADSRIDSLFPSLPKMGRTSSLFLTFHYAPKKGAGFEGCEPGPSYFIECHLSVVVVFVVVGM